jgi:hypothetical protein
LPEIAHVTDDGTDVHDASVLLIEHVIEHRFDHKKRP